MNSTPKFYCRKCDFKCYKKSDYTRHLNTKKHANKQVIDCGTCGKIFNSRSTLWRHSKKCNGSGVEYEDNIFMGQEETQIVDPSVVMELVKTNMEFRQMCMTQSQQISTILDSVSNGTLANNSHNTNSNNRFNINIFLNEQCKDAMNIEDFVESIDFTLDDLEETGRHGYVKGISRIITNKLQSMDLFSRPLHCTDAKRETLYIKEENNWKKDDEQHTMFRNVIAEVAEKNEGMIEEWKESHPLCNMVGTKETDQIMEIYFNTMTGSNEEHNKYNKKIIKNVLKEVMITKEIVV
jgi:hypothetical protein